MAIVYADEVRQDLKSMRIPTKKIIRSELKTITTSPGDAVGIIVEQVIVMGQEESRTQSALFRFCRFSARCSRKVCLSTPLRVHLFDPSGKISPVIQIQVHS